jgi:glycosyltransferase involved in cell wall biosynthesis
LKQLTIFTPTYNRENNLKKLYNSLLSQKCKNFIWLIIDDGSTDGTRKLVEKWVSENKIEIELFVQENQGKHIAMKTAFYKCKTEWIICVDSDDMIAKNAVEDILKDISEGIVEKYIGYIYPRLMKNEKKLFPKDRQECNSIMDAKNLYGITETAIVLKNEYLRLIEIPKYEREKFLSEEIIYMQLAKYGKVMAKNRLFYISEYQEDGLTNKIFELWKNNPQGTLRLLYDRYLFSRNYSFRFEMLQKIKTILNFNAVCIIDQIPIFKNSPSKIWSGILIIPSILWCKIRFGD